MATVDPVLEPVLTALVQRLRELDIAFCIIGALVPELLLETKPAVRTNDADAVVFVPDVAAFDALKKDLASGEFSETAVPYRLTYREAGFVDILPYSHDLAPDGILRLAPDVVMNLAGFDRILDAAVDVTLDSGLVVPVAPLSLYALLKLCAYADRRAQKDLDSVEHLLRHYGEDDDRRFGLEHAGTLVDYDHGPAYLLGIDGASSLTPDLSTRLRPLLVSLSKGSTGLPVEGKGNDEREPAREDLFFWYRLGLGL